MQELLGLLDEMREVIVEDATSRRRFGFKKKPKGARVQAERRRRRIYYRQNRSEILRKATKYRRSATGSRTKRRRKLYYKTHKKREGFRLAHF